MSFSNSGDFCKPTQCPNCRAKVFFVRHNGGSVWFDDLGWPWPKHPCFDSVVLSGTKRSETGLPIAEYAQSLLSPLAGLVTKTKVNRPGFVAVHISGLDGRLYLSHLQTRQDLSNLTDELVAFSLVDKRIVHSFIPHFIVAEIQIIGNKKNTVQKSTSRLRSHLSVKASLSNSGVEYLRREQFQEAISTFKRAIKTNPQFAEAHYNLAVAYSKLHQPENALPHFISAAQIKPRFSMALYGLGLTYIELNQLEEASLALKRAMRVKPDYVETYLSLGMAFMQQKRYSESVKVFKELLKVTPNSDQAHLALGQAYQALGDTNQLLTHFQLLKDLNAEMSLELLTLLPPRIQKLYEFSLRSAG